MIISALIYLGAFIAQTILLVFPNSSGFPSEVDSAVSFLAGYVGILDPLVPMDTLLQVLTLVIVYELAIFAFKGFRWLFSHVPLVGGKG